MTASEKVTVIGNGSLTGALALLVMVTVGAAVSGAVSICCAIQIAAARTMSTAPWSAFGETLGEGGASAKYGLAAVPVRSRQALESGFCVGADPQMAPNRMTRRGSTNNRESTDNHAGERRLRGYHTPSDRYCIVALRDPLILS